MMTRVPLIVTQAAKRYTSGFACGVALGMLTLVTATSADDTEVFYGQVTTDSTSASNAPNVLFVLDDSLSMLSKDTGQVGTRMFRLRQAMDTILTQVKNVNIGVVTLNGDDGGGPVRYPVTPIDKPVCADGGCDEVLLYSQINENNNDVAQSIGSGVMISGSDELTIGFDGGTPGDQQIVGLRFEELGIPQGAVITSAVLEVNSTQDATAGGTISVWADDSDSAEPFSSNDDDLTDRTPTTESISFSPGAVTVGETYESEDLSSIIQELVDRPGWCGGSDIALMVSSSNSHSILSQEGATSIGELNQEGATSANDSRTANLRVSYDSSGLLEGEGCVHKTLVYQVQGGNNDAREFLDTHVINFGSANMHLPKTSTADLISAFRFRNLEIDPGTEIIDAQMEFVVSESGDGIARNKISAVNMSHSKVTPAGNGSITNLPLTSESVIWEESTVALAGSKIYTNDLAPIVREIVERGDWAYGNAITMIFEDDASSGFHTVKAFNASPSLASRLYITVKSQVGQGGSISSNELTARDELKNLMNELRTNYWTPQLGAQYEAAKYFLGGPVSYGRKRGGNVINSNFRISHPDSYTGGEVFTPLGCNSANPYDADCQDEEILDDASGAGPTYISPMLDSCQSNHMVILGDGAPTTETAAGRIHSLIGDSTCSGANCGAALAEWLMDNDHAHDITGKQNILTHTIAFNQGGSGLALLDSIAAAGGTGQAYSASSADELITAFTSIISSALSIDTSFAAPGATVSQFNRLSHRDDLYFALFKPSENPRWEGNLKRYKLGTSDDGTSILDFYDNDAVDETTGFFNTTARSFWQHLDKNGNLTTVADGTDVTSGGAASRIGVEDIEYRELYTYISNGTQIPAGGAQLSNGDYYLHEDNALITSGKLGISAITPDADRELYREELIKWVRGLDRLDNDGDDDIDEPRRQMGDPLHTNPVIVNYDVSDSDDDMSVAYISTNAGFLHAIDTLSGNEIWSFSPEELLENHYLLYDNSQATGHPYGLDGPLSIMRAESNNDLVIESDESVYLYSSMRRGGSNYYAFDISEPDSPILMWVIKGGPDGTPGYEELGQSWSEATTARILYEGDVRDVLVFGAGYDTNQDADPIRDSRGNAVSMEHTEDAIGRGLFIVDALTGERIWSVSGPDVGSDSDPDQRFDDMTYSIPGSIRVVDVDFDGLVDQMYASDTGGRVWRFDITSDATDGVNLLQGGIVADISTSDDEGHRRFYSEPDVALIQEDGVGYMAISIGSGWRDHPLNDVVEDAQYFIRSPEIRTIPAGYGIEGSSGIWRPIVESDLQQVNTDSTVDPNYSNGWFLRLPDSGEKVLGSSIIFNNVVYFTTYVPDAIVDACGVALGSGYLYALSAFNGQPVLDFDDDGTIEDSSHDMRYALKHTGIPASPSILIAENQNPAMFVGTEQIPSSIYNTTKRTYWLDSGID